MSRATISAMSRAGGAPFLALMLLAAVSACSRSTRGGADEHAVDHASMHHSAAATQPEVALRPEVVQALGIRTEPAVRGALPSELHVFGVTTYDQRTVTPVFAPTAGWVQKLAVRAVGERVRVGSVLLDIYSPNLATADAQLVDAVAANGLSPLENPYARGLRSLGITDDLILDVIAKRRSPGHFPVQARASGTVSSLDVRLGQLLEQGTPILEIAALDSVWVTAYVPAQKAASVTPGMEGRVTSVASPGEQWTAHVDSVYSELDGETRDLPVRLVIRNKAEALRANLPVSVTLLGQEAENVTHVALDAVIRDGREDRVVVALGDGRFAARQVRVGRVSGDRIVVLEGLEAGEQVVTAGQFLIDSESSMRSALTRLSSDAPHHVHH